MRRSLNNFWLVIPVLGLITFLIIFPLSYSFWASLYGDIKTGGMPIHFIGFENYMKVVSSLRFLKATGRTFYYTTVSVFIKTLLGLMAALLLNREFKGRGVIRGLTIVPWTIPLFVIGLIWYGMYSWTGPVNHLLKSFGLTTINWFGREWAMTAIIIVNIWKGFPFYFIGFLAGLQGISRELYEAARVDGASAWQSFRHITLPGLRPVMLTVALLSTIWTFSEFVTIYLLTQGGPGMATETLPILVFQKAFAEFQPNIAVTMSIVILPFYLALIFYVIKVLTK